MLLCRDTSHCHTFSLQVEYSAENETLTRSFRISTDADGNGGVRFDPKPKRRAADDAGGGAAAAAAKIQLQMCDLALKDAASSRKQPQKQKPQIGGKPAQIYSAAFLDQKIAEQEVTVEVRSFTYIYVFVNNSRHTSQTKQPTLHNK